MKNTSKDSGAKFILFSGTREVQVDDKMFKALEKHYPNIPLAFDNLDKRLATLSENEGIAYVSSLVAMRELQASGKAVHLSCDKHWSRDAHQRAADLLADYLETGDYL